MMKRALSLGLLACLMLALLLPMLSSCSAGPATETLYVYNWGEYISDGSEDSRDVNREFELYCKNVLGKNVKVNYSTFSSNEDMYAKISSGSASYDVIVPSDYMIQRMVAEELLMPLNMDLIPNYQYVSDDFKGENVYYEDDPTNDVIYSVPYFYGMVGVIYNTAVVDENDEDIGSWSLMWDEDYKRNILQFNNSRDAFGTALYALGYDVNNATDEQWREALELLKEQKSVVQGYVMDEIFNKMKSGSAGVAAYYAGDFLSMYEDNNDLAFFYPGRGFNGEAGTNIYIDAMCVPKNSQNPELAMAYINFMCERDNAVANALYTYYASPLTNVVEDAEYQEAMAEVHEDAMTILYGDHEALEKAQPYLNLEPERLVMLNGLWEELKGASSIGKGIYVGCGVILAALVVIVGYQIIKKRRWAKLYD